MHDHMYFQHLDDPRFARQLEHIRVAAERHASEVAERRAARAARRARRRARRRGAALVGRPA